MFIGKMVNAFQLDHKHILDENVGEIFSNGASFIADTE